MLGSNPGLLRLWHWQPDAQITRLDLIHTRIDLLYTRLDLITESLLMYVQKIVVIVKIILLLFPVQTLSYFLPKSLTFLINWQRIWVGTERLYLNACKPLVNGEVQCCGSETLWYGSGSGFLFSLLLIRFLILIRVMQVCDHLATDPLRLYFEPPRLHCER